MIPRVSIPTLLLMAAICFLLVGCGPSQEVRTPGSPAPAPGSSPLAVQLVAIGIVMLWAGAITGALGVGLRIASVFGALGPLGFVAPLIPFLPGLGVGAAAIGAALVWLSYNLWLLGVTCALTVVALGVHYRRIVRHWLVVGEDPHQTTP